MSNAISHTAFLDFFNDGTYPSIRQQFSTHNFKAKYRCRTWPRSTEIVIELLVQDQMTHQTSSISIGYPWHWVLDKKTKISEFRMIDIPKKNQSLNRLQINIHDTILIWIKKILNFRMYSPAPQYSQNLQVL